MAISNGYDIPAVSSGAASKGYFGSQTKMALINFQRALISSLWFLRAMTRERLNGGDNNNQNASLRVTSPNGGEIADGNDAIHHLDRLAECT